MEVAKFVADQTEAVRLGRSLYCEEKVSCGLRADALNFAFALANLNSTPKSMQEIIADARIAETYLQAKDSG